MGVEESSEELKSEMLYLYGAGVGCFLVDTLHQLMADAALVSITRCWRRVSEIHLEEKSKGKVN